MKQDKNSVLWLVFIFIMISTVIGYAVEKIEKYKILQYKGWESVYEKFTVDNSLIEALASKTDKNLEINVYFTFWCGDSKNNVPPFLKIIENINDLNNTDLAVNYYIVKKKPTLETKYYVEDLKIERIPTFIFYRYSKEIGRIIENPKKTLIEDFLEIVF